MLTRVFLFLILTCSGICLSSLPPSFSDWNEWLFHQKIGWRGLHLDSRIPYELLVDKLEVKKYVCDDILVAKTFFATDDPELIFMESLPNIFMMKANNACDRGLLVKDGMLLLRKKDDYNFVPIPVTNEILRSYAKKWLKIPFMPNTEFQYGLIKPMILFEEYLHNYNKEIQLFCFYGETKLIRIFFRGGNRKKQDPFSYYDLNWNLLDCSHSEYETKKIDKPEWLDKLLSFAEKFTTTIDHVRVDFFLDDQDLYFGEFTFTTEGGWTGLIPDDLQKFLGSCWDYPNLD